MNHYNCFLNQLKIKFLVDVSRESGGSINQQ